MEALEHPWFDDLLYDTEWVAWYEKHRLRINIEKSKMGLQHKRKDIKSFESNLLELIRSCQI